MKDYKGVVFDGATFPDSPYKIYTVKPNSTITNEYIPALNKVVPAEPKGMNLLVTAMAIQEGFNKGTRSYRTNNPGNIGNTDSGSNNLIPTLTDGIKLQINFIKAIVNNQKKAYPIGKFITIPEYYSPEIAAHPEYGLPANLPGYKFTFTGQLDQFVKIYSTGARATNSYINLIVSYFSQNNLAILPTSKLQDIIAMS